MNNQNYLTLTIQNLSGDTSMIMLSEKDEDMLDFLYYLGVDFVIQREEYDEYHVALPSV